MITYFGTSADLSKSPELSCCGEACACTVHSGTGGRCESRSLSLISDITEGSPRVLAGLSLLPALTELCEGGGVLM